MPKLETLVDDIYEALSKINDGQEVVDEETLDGYIDTAVDNIRASLKSQLTPRTGKRKDKAIYASEAGKPCHRYVWYAINETERTPLPPEVKIKFIQGDLLEELLGLLSRVAGHEVTDEQKFIEIELPKGWRIRGKMDFKIDGAIVDAKSASKSSFNKFVDGSLKDLENDPFGYMTQLGNYVTHEGEHDQDAGFLAINKETCQLAVFQPDPMDLMAAIPDYEQLVDDLENPIGPDRAYHDEQYDNYGSRVLGRQCGYCDYKKTCWADANRGKGLRAFKKKEWWGWDTKYFTHIEREPRLTEVDLL